MQNRPRPVTICQIADMAAERPVGIVLIESFHSFALCPLSMLWKARIEKFLKASRPILGQLCLLVPGEM